MNEILQTLTEKKQKLDKYRPLPPELVRNLEDWFRVELTYTSNAIEGNTLTRQETALIVEKGLTVDGKTLKEHLEAVNHAAALAIVISLAQNKEMAISEADILDIQRLILSKIEDANAGRYRSVAVRIAGAAVVLPNPVKVPQLMAEFVHWLQTAQGHPAEVAAQAHYRLVSIHPFVDGNGRTARLLMNLILVREGYPPAIIRKEDRRKYINALEKAQTGGSRDDFTALIYEAVGRSLDIYLEALEPKEAGQMEQNLLKIGELARKTGETIHTLRYWTKEGLLPVQGHTPGGYQLYSPAMIARVGEIRCLQMEKRLTITEIRDVL
ncbi:MAG: Fic family protein [Anaerolineales bacterium]|nr:Fic family protein [Anaerolineales bacterium]